MSSAGFNYPKFLIALANFPKFGPVRLKKIMKHFPSPENAFTASAKELMSAGIEENVANEFAAFRHNLNPNALIDNLIKENVRVITIADESYPKLLKEIYDPPQLLYYKGQLDANDEFSIAVVGTRKYTAYGKMVVEKITKELAINNLVIISGLALGIDALAHIAALEAGGRTVAVLGSGLDQKNIYPSSNRYLANKILASDGAIISEFPLGTPPLRHHFPQRNRIVSGLCLGTLVIEAGEKSGSLITAKFALDQNREVFAVPGSIYSPLSAGSNDLIKRGARVVTSANDIIEALDLAKVATYIENKKIIPDSAEEEIIVANLTHEPSHINELARLTSLDINILNSTLTIMEMKGMVKNLGGMQYILIN